MPASRADRRDRDGGSFAPLPLRSVGVIEDLAEDCSVMATVDTTNPMVGIRSEECSRATPTSVSDKRASEAIGPFRELVGTDRSRPSLREGGFPQARSVDVRHRDVISGLRVGCEAQIEARRRSRATGERATTCESSGQCVRRFEGAPLVSCYALVKGWLLSGLPPRFFATPPLLAPLLRSPGADGAFPLVLGMYAPPMGHAGWPVRRREHDDRALVRCRDASRNRLHSLPRPTAALLVSRSACAIDCTLGPCCRSWRPAPASGACLPGSWSPPPSGDRSCLSCPGLPRAIDCAGKVPMRGEAQSIARGHSTDDRLTSGRGPGTRPIGVAEWCN